MALELAEHDITVNAVAPGEIAAAIAFLASPGGRCVTGESLVIDGGLSMIGAEANRIAGDG